MATNQSFRMKIKNNLGTYTELPPKTAQSQVLEWSVGETFGPYNIVLKRDGWAENRQIIDFKGVSPDDIIACLRVLSGTKEQMLAQAKAYGKLKHVGGIVSMDNAIGFACTEVPDIDIQVQVWWTR